MSADSVTFPAKESPCYINSLYLFIHLSSEKNESRSATAVIGLNGLPPWSPLGSAELAFAQTVLALFPPSPLRLHRPIKAGTFSVFESFSNPSVTACHLPYISLRKHPVMLRGTAREEGGCNPLFIVEKCTYIALRQPVRLRDTAGRSVRVPLYYYTDSHLPVSSGVKPLWWA